MPHVYLIIEAQTGEVLAANLSVDGAWLSAMRYGPDELTLADGSELTVEALNSALADAAEITLLGSWRDGERASIIVQRHMLGI